MAYDDLIQEFGSAPAKEAVITPHEDLINEFGSGTTAKPSRKEKLKAEAPERRKQLSGFLKSIPQGGLDVVNAGASAIGFVDSFLPGGEARNENLQKRIAAENESFKEANPPSEGILPSAPELGRTTGQMIATAPLVPMKAMQGIRGVLGALPSFVAGEKVAAPFINRAGAAAITGGLTGGEFGALTSTSNDKSLLENFGEGLITGAIAAPVITAFAAAGKNIIPAGKSLWANVQINKLAENAKMEPSAVKKIIEYLDNAGFSPQQAQAELNRLGPQATLGDLSSSLQARVGGLATFDPKAMEIVKGRYEARGKTANSQAHDLMEAKLGVKPDLDAEKTKIIEDARKAVAPDYEAGKKVNGLNVQSVVDKIDSELSTGAVGEKAQALKLVRSYLYKDGVDAAGEPTKVLKHNAKELHEVRMAIDTILEGKNPKTSYGSITKGQIGDIRKGIDAELKTIPEFAAADAKFAKEIEKIKDIEIGENLLKNNGMNIQKFARFFDALPIDRKTAIAKGLHGHIGDLMEQATRGELSEAQRLFGKSSKNRANLEKVFGNRGAEVLDELQKEATMRGTERSILARSHTAEGQAVQREFGERSDGGGAREIAQGMVIDTLSGNTGVATAIMGVKRAGSSFISNVSGNRQDRLIRGTADLLSRSGVERDSALGVAERVKAVQDKIKPKYNLSLPPKSATYLFSAPAGQIGYSQYKRVGQE